MTLAQQTESERYRLVVFRNNGGEILVGEQGLHFALPAVEIPKWQRVAPNLVAALKHKWNCEAVCLPLPQDSPSPDGDQGPRYQAMECLDPRKNDTCSGQWRSVRALSRASFDDAWDHAALERCLAGLGSRVPGGPFARLGWFRELETWVADALCPFGIRLTGEFCQWNSSPSFSLVRFATSGRAVWFKAVEEPNQREFPITLTLARRFPAYVPTVLATRPEWNGWLSLEAEGTGLDRSADLTLWRAAAAALAELQIAAIGRTRDLVGEGAHDLEGSAFSATVVPFFDAMTRLMERQIKVPPRPLHEIELQLLGQHVRGALDRMEALGIPATLGHLDANPGNIIVSRDRCAFLDWAEAYVGSPFFTFQYLLEYQRRLLGEDARAEAMLAESYFTPWEALVPQPAIREASDLIPLLALFAYAAGTGVSNDERRLEDPTTAGYLRGLTRRMQRMAQELAERRGPCLH